MHAARAHTRACVRSQVRFLLASFKQRGRSLAFLPRNVQLLREQLAALAEERRAVEAQLLETTAEMCVRDERAQLDQARISRLERQTRRSALGTPAKAAQLDAPLEELTALREGARAHAAAKAELQGRADKCVEQLFQLSNALDATDEQHNDDSLLQFMLFSSA